jgi:hypothetical protein
MQTSFLKNEHDQKILRKIKVKGGEGGFREYPSPQIRLLIGVAEIGE